MVTFNLLVIVPLLLGLVFGAATVWVWVRSRTNVELERVKSEGAVELASVRERVGRIPGLEAQLTKALEAEDLRRAEVLRLTEELAERRQQLRSTEEQLVETKTQLTSAEDKLAALSVALTSQLRKR